MWHSSAVGITKTHWYNKISSTFHLHLPLYFTYQVHHCPPLLVWPQFGYP